MANLDVGAKQFVSLDIGAVQSPGVSPDFTESLSDTLVLSDSTGEGRGYLFTDTISLADALGTAAGVFGEQAGDSLFLKDAAAVDFVYSPPGGQRGNIDYDQIRLSARAGTGAKLHTLTGSVTTGHGVVFDANGNLVDSGAAPGGGMAIGDAIGSGTDGSVLFVGGGNLAQDNANLFYDDTNNYLGIGTAAPAHPLHISADDPLSAGVPIEQVMVENPSTTGTTDQANIAFKVWDGAAHTTIGWVGVTAGSFTFAPYANATYLENFSSGGVVILADDPTNGHIGLFSGGYTSNDYKRLHIDAAGQVVVREFDGSTQGLQIQLVSQNANAAKSYTNINLYDGSTLLGQIIGTASNYVNAAINIGASGIAILTEVAAGHLLLGAAGASGTVRINAGGYDSTFTTVEFAAAGGFSVLRGGITFSGATSSDYIKADGSGYGIPTGTGGTTHSESLTDGNSNFIFAAGDIVTVVGVPN